MRNHTAARIRMLLPLLLVFLLVGCQSPTTEVSTQPEAENSTGPVFPEVEIPNPVPDPEKGKSNVVGKIIGPDPVENIGLILYLGDLIQVNEDEIGGFLDQSKAPRALFDPKSGQFVFQNVEPGKYSLILYQVELGGQAYLAPNGSVQIIEARVDETVDLGDITYQQ